MTRLIRQLKELDMPIDAIWYASILYYRLKEFDEMTNIKYDICCEYLTKLKKVIIMNNKTNEIVNREIKKLGEEIENRYANSIRNKRG